MTKQEYILCAAIKRLKPIEVKAYNYKTGSQADYFPRTCIKTLNMLKYGYNHECCIKIYQNFYI